MKKLIKKPSDRRNSLLLAYWFDALGWYKWHDVDNRSKGGCWVRKYDCRLQSWEFWNSCAIGDTKEIKIC